MIDPTFEIGQKDTPVSDSQARKTTLIVGCVLLVITGWNIYRRRFTTASVIGGIGLALIAVGVLLPMAARWFHTFWMKVAAVLGYVNSRILLTLMYYGIFTPYGLVSQLARRDPLQRRGENRESYWIERKRTRQTREEFERLF